MVTNKEEKTWLDIEVAFYDWLWNGVTCRDCYDQKHEAPEKYPDNCKVCLGQHAGIQGNENIVDGITMCDICAMEAATKAEGKI